MKTGLANIFIVIVLSNSLQVNFDLGQDFFWCENRAKVVPADRVTKTAVWPKCSVPTINIVSSVFSLAESTLEKQPST